MALMLCRKGASRGRWVIIQARFCRLVAWVQKRHPGCSGRFKGSLLRSTRGLESRSQSRAGSPDRGPQRGPNPQATPGGGTAAKGARSWLLPRSALALGRAPMRKVAEGKKPKPLTLLKAWCRR